jgi:hypothetical protein
MASETSYHSTEAATKAIEFAPGIISTEKYFEINTVFNKTGESVIFSRCSDDFNQCTLMESKYISNEWTTPTPILLSGQYLDADPYYNEDYSTLYFISNRPMSSNTSEPLKSVNMWKMDLVDGVWQKPHYLPNLSSDADDLYPSITNNGDLYFPSFRNNNRKMYVATANGHGFDKPKALPTDMFGEGGKIGDTVVLRNGKSMIFSMRRSDSLGKGDLYISFKKEGEWSVAKSLGDKVNTVEHEFTPIVSPNGEYLFFTRIENGKGNLYQIKLTALGLNLNH